MSELQEDWITSTIGAVADINVRPKKGDLDDDTLASFVPMKCVEAESGRFAPPEIKKLREVKKGCTPMRDGDVIFAQVTPCMENGRPPLFVVSPTESALAPLNSTHYARRTTWCPSFYLLHWHPIAVEIGGRASEIPSKPAVVGPDSAELR